MSNYFTRMASLVLAFGFFISCSTFSNSSAPNGDPDSFSETELKQAISDINRSISQGDSSHTLIYRKGVYLMRLAQKKSSASERTPLYTEALTALHSLDDSSGKITRENVRELLSVNWSNEHNEGVQIIRADSVLDREEYSRAAAHFNNATIIIPDSLISYEIGARAYYKSGQIDKAVNLLEKSRNYVNPLPAPMLEQLAFLYLENNQPKKATEVYEEAESFTDNDLNLLHGLSNAYIKAGAHRKSVSALKKLLELQPGNTDYRITLATEYYFLADRKVDSLINAGSLQTDNITRLNELLSNADNHYKQVSEGVPGMVAKAEKAQFYHNAASLYQQLLPIAEEGQKPEIKNKIRSFLSSAVPLFEELTEKKPQHRHYWENLYQAYSYLGMNEKARIAKSNL